MTDLVKTVRIAVINATQHASTAEQVAAGVYRDLNVSQWLTFDELPSQLEMEFHADEIGSIIWEAHSEEMKANFIEPREEPCYAMIGGAPWFMPVLERVLRDNYGIRPIYAFSKRESVEEVQADGSVRKTAVFRHAGFIGL